MLIRGIVTSRGGGPIEGAAVVFVATPADVADVGALTGADGSFVLSAPARGRYRIAVRSEEHVVRELDVIVREAADVVVSVELERGPMQA